MCKYITLLILSLFLTTVSIAQFNIRAHRLRPTQDTTFYTPYNEDYQVRRVYYERPDTDWIETIIWNKLGPITKEVAHIHESTMWLNGDSLEVRKDTLFNFILNAVINGETKKFYLQEMKKEYK